MNKLGVRAGLVAVMTAGLTAGAFLMLPAHASNTALICTSRTGKAVCASVDLGKRLVNAQVFEGRAPTFPDMTGLSVACVPGHIVVATALNGKVSATRLPLGC